jgi:hypothetical protein
VRPIAIAPTPAKKRWKASSPASARSTWNSHSSELSLSAMNPSRLVAV